jgi:lysophospholipase L1-like esterase
LAVVVERVRIVGWGDSTTAGTPAFLSPVESPPHGKGNEQSQYAYWIMKSHEDWVVLNKGINGQRTDQILARFERDVAAERPDVTIILAGVNDIYQGRPIAKVQENLREMYRLVAQLGSAGIACSVLPYNTMTPSQARARKELNKWIRGESTRSRIVFSDTAAAVSSREAPDRLVGTPDGLHPDVEGYRRMAGELSDAVMRALSAPSRK